MSLAYAGAKQCTKAPAHCMLAETVSPVGRLSCSNNAVSCRYVLITPLVNREWGHAVLVNRGWVPAEWKTDAQLRASGCPMGRVLVPSWTYGCCFGHASHADAAALPVSVHHCLTSKLMQLLPFSLRQGLLLEQVHIEGVIRESEKPSSFVPANTPAKGEWYWVDVPNLARAAGLPPDTPLMEVCLPLLCRLTASSKQGWCPVVDMPCAGCRPL